MGGFPGKFEALIARAGKVAGMVPTLQSDNSLQLVASSTGFITPDAAGNMGAAVTVPLAGLPGAVFTGTLSAADCAINFTGFTVGKWSGALCYVTGAVGKTAHFTDTIIWVGGYPPVFSTSGVTAFTVSSPDGVTLYGSHNQQTRLIAWGPGNATTAVSAIASPNFPIFRDARVVDGIVNLSTAGTVQATITDVLVNGATAYPTHTKPTVPTNGTTSGAVALPDNPLLTPGQTISYNITQFGTSAAGLIIVMKLLEAP